MSNYGVFEASSTDGHEEEQRQRKAKRNLGTAIEAAREGFGDFLGSSTDKQDYQDRLALVMNDLMQKVADAGVMPVPGVMRKVKAALRPEFRQAARRVQANDYGPDTYPTAMDAFQAWLVDEGLTDAEGPVLMTFQDRHGEGWSDDDLDIDLSRVDKGNAFTSTRKQANDIPWFSNRDGSDEVIFSNGSYMLVNPDGSWQVGDGTFMTTGQESSVERAKEVATEQLFFFGSKSAQRKQAGDLEDFESWVSEEANSVYDSASASRYLSTFPSGEEPFDNDPDALLYAYENQFAEASRKQASGWYQEYDGSWSITLPGDVVGWLRPTDDPELPDTFTVSAEIDNEENGRELFTEFGISEAEGKRMVEEAAAKVIASRRKAGLSDWFIDGTDFAQMSYDGMPDGNFAFLNVYLHGDGYYMWSVDVENGQANHGKLNATDLESAIAEAEPLISAELGLDPFMYSTRKKVAETPWYKRWDRTEDEILDELYDMEGVRDDAVRNGFDSTSAENRIQELREELNYTKRNSSRKQGSAYLPVVSVEQNTGDSYMAEISGGFAFEAYDEGGAWVWSIFDNSGDEVASDEASSLDAAKDAAAYALDRVASRKVDSRRKQAGSAQVLQKLEDALNDQRSVDVICSNSPDGSFSGEREISVDEGLQKVRGWVSAGDLVDTAQGGNFFDFEHRASGENVNFYITQEY